MISKKGLIFNLVDERKRAWHAGKSYWKGDYDINSFSIGIELDFTPQTPYGGSHTLTLVCKGNDTGSSGWKTIFHKGQDMCPIASVQRSKCQWYW